MKKLITIILILALLLPAAALADNMSGIWSVWMPNSATFGSGNLTMILVLNEDATFAIINIVAKDGQINTQTRNGTWYEQNGKIRIASEGYMPAALEYRDGKIWFENGGMNVGMVKMPDYDASQLEYLNK